MKENTKAIFIIGVIVLFAIILSAFSLKKKELNGTNFSFQVNKSSKCSTEKLYSFSDFDVYTYCVDEVFISDGETKVTLSEYLDSKKEDGVDIIISNLKHEWAMYDGGTEKFSDEVISVIKCGKMDMREDIYVGIPSMELDENYCNVSKFS